MDISSALTGLGQIHASLCAMYAQDDSQCRDLSVTVFDPDVVTPFNVGRQLFYETDIGLNKAECLVGRVNLAYGVRWRAVTKEFGKGNYKDNINNRPDVVISCVDTASARRDIHKGLWGSNQSYMNNTGYWLDCGNLATVGQVVLGQPGHSDEEEWPRNLEFDPDKALWKGQRKKQIPGPDAYNQLRFEDRRFIRLPCVTELFPDLMDEDFDETDEPSCSMVDALKKQSLFVNRMTSAYALDLLWELIKDGKVDNQGCYFNLRTRTAQPIPLRVWPVEPKRDVGPADDRLKVN
jgi:PRTRC genetic system ThiF family protein